MVTTDVAFASLTELARGLRTGTYSSVELVQVSLDRIARLDERAHSYVSVFRESALLAARDADAQRSAPPVPRKEEEPRGHQVRAPMG